METRVIKYRSFAVLIPLIWLFLIVQACTGIHPPPVFEDNQLPQPGDEEYVPTGWAEPQLAYADSAYFPVEVVVSEPATIVTPGQHANSEVYGVLQNMEKLLGPPSGGGVYTPDSSSVVSLGMAGGSVTVRFDPPLENHPDNIGGYDFIVFGNAYWSGGGPENAWQEPGVVWVMKDENLNGEPDDTWYLIPGSHQSTGQMAEITYSSSDGGLPPPAEFKDQWWPDGVLSPLAIPNVFLLPDTLYSTGGSNELCWGYGDVTPTLRLGDLSGADGADEESLSDPEDYPGIDPVFFYTVPDTHGDRAIDPGSGGGDAMKLEWAVNPDTLATVTLDQVSWVRIASATHTTGVLGEFSCEVDAIVRVRRSP